MILSLLRVADDPVQDIPLLSVLISPIYGFMPNELGTMRLCLPKAPLCLALSECTKSGETRATGVIEELNDFHSPTVTLPSDRLLNTIYQRTGYLMLVQAVANSGQRLSNFQLLMEYAKKCGASDYSGLSGFVRFTDRLQGQNGDLPRASTISEASSVVHIMNIHKSEGFEFPVRILAGCSRHFDKEHSDILLYPELNLGIRRKEQGGLARMTTLPRGAIALEQERQSMSGELRALCITTTHAQEKLILPTTVCDLSTTLVSLAPQLTTQERISPYVVHSASGISNWILSCALHHPSGRALRDRALCSGELIVGYPGQPWEICALPTPDLEEDPGQEESVLAVPPPDPELLTRVAREIDSTYPDAALFEVPAKVSASELAAGSAGEDYEILSRPAFLEKTGLTPTERGTALHHYMQFTDHSVAAEGPQQELERLRSGGFLSEEGANAVDLRHVSAFFQGPVARRMLASEQSYCELRFTMEISASLPRADVPAEQQVVLQGAVDCALIEPDGVVIIGYKTDRTASPEELWDRYHVQLALYRLTVERVLGLPVKKCMLYSFSLDRIVTDELNAPGETGLVL